VVGSGRTNAAGGETGRRAGEDQAGRSEGMRAAVQSRPTHQRWFSWIVRRKRSVWPEEESEVVEVVVKERGLGRG